MALQEERWWGMTDLHTAAKQDIPDLIAGALGVSRGTAYDMMREALAEQPAPVQEPLTPDQVFAIADQHPVEGFDPEIMAFARAIEAAHGIKGGA